MQVLLRAPAPVPAAPPAPSKPQSSATVVESSDKAVNELLKGWAEAWAFKKYDAYLGFYASKFVPAKGLAQPAWKKLRKDALKLALRAFNSESEYCIDNVKFNNVEKMAERIRKSFETCNKLLKNVEAWWKDIVLDRKL